MPRQAKRGSLHIPKILIELHARHRERNRRLGWRQRSPVSCYKFLYAPVHVPLFTSGAVVIDPGRGIERCPAVKPGDLEERRLLQQAVPIALARISSMSQSTSSRSGSPQPDFRPTTPLLPSGRNSRLGLCNARWRKPEGSSGKWETGGRSMTSQKMAPSSIMEFTAAVNP